MNKEKRPTSVVISLIFISLAGLSLILRTLFTFTIPGIRQDISLTTAILWAVVGCAVYMVSGIAIFKELNWGRLLYLCFVPIWIILWIIISGFHLTTYIFIDQIIFYIFILMFLTKPTTLAFFLPTSKPVPEKVSNWWYAFPFFLGIIGGIIAWAVNKNRDPEKAVGFVIIGLVIGLILAIISVM